MLSGHIKKKLDYFRNKWKERDFLISVMEDNKAYLASGTYRVSWTGKRKIYLKNKNTRTFLLKNKQQSNSSFLFQIKSVIDFIAATFSTIAVTNHGEQKIRGELVMMTYSSNIKIFDFTQKIILNKMAADPETYKRVKHGYKSFRDHFKLTILGFRDEEQVYFEKYLEFIPYNRWEAGDIRKCINGIFNSYIHYFAASDLESTATKNPADLLEEIKGTGYGNHKLVATLEEWLRISPKEMFFPVVRGHGDMKFENILLAEEEFHFIDLEFSGYYFFIYDVVNFIFNEAMNGDYSYIKAYLKGEYDEKYKELFEIFGLELESGKKLYYIAVYLIDRICHYDLEVTLYRMDLKGMLDQYLQVLTKVEELKEQYKE